MTHLIPIAEPRRAEPVGSGFALWNLGFRPFYLFAGAFSSLSILLWAAQYAGWLSSAYLAGPVWHAHEMLFGYTLAVIVGFLFTAGRVWTGMQTVRGRRLVLLAMLWLAGRVLVLTPWPWAAAIANVAFPLSAALLLAIPFWRARCTRNYIFVGLLTGLGILSLWLHGVQLGVFTQSPWRVVSVALDVVLLIMVIMGGRVIPGFTNNALPEADARRHKGLEYCALFSAALVLLSDIAFPPATLTAALLIAAASVNAVRLLLWHPLRTLSVPLVWVLHVAYAWIVVHLLLRGLTLLGLTSSMSATHALTVGGIGMLTLGMMTRTARGHTGRNLRADRVDTACYLLVWLAALIRVFMPVIAPGRMLEAIVISACLWSVGFALFTARYWPVLVRPRIDGLPG